MPYITGINDTLNPFNSNPTEGHSPTSATTPAACNEKIEHNARIFKVQQFGESPLQR